MELRSFNCLQHAHGRQRSFDVNASTEFSPPEIPRHVLSVYTLMTILLQAMGIVGKGLRPVCVRSSMSRDILEGELN